MNDGAALRMIRAEIASGKATKRSLGVLYMVAMASHRATDGFGGFGDFTEINGVLMDHFGKETAAERALSLEPVKKIGWELYEAIARQKGPFP